MESSSGLVETLFERAEEYSNTTVELIKLNAIRKSADVASSLIARLAILLIVALCILIISIGVALYLGGLLGKAYDGFFIIGALYGLIGILLHAFRQQWIKYPICDSIIKQLLKHQ
jgi:hypothetical protein